MNGPAHRIAIFDVLRGAALAAMAIYHFSWDLEFFALADIGVTEKPLWIAFSKLIAASFLALVGVSLVLAHGAGIRWVAFARRLAVIAAAAGAITLMSRFADSTGVIWFGILHCIAVSSVLALAFLRTPVWLVITAALVCIAAPFFLTSPYFDAPHWLWLGLASEPLPSNDYDPLLPWFGAVLAGVAVARLLLPHAADAFWARWKPRSMLTRALVLAGRHSLLFYLVHQPLLIGILWAVTQVLGRS